MKAKRLFLLLTVFALATPAFCYTYMQVGMNSNFLIDAGKVYFVQADETLTALNLDSGEVLARKSNIKHGGTLRVVGQGILVLGYEDITCLDRSSLEVVWKAKNAHDSMIDCGRLVSYDGNGLLECRDVATGKIRWSYNLPGALDIVTQKAKVLVFRSAEYDGKNGVPAVVLLDLESGQELMHKTTPPKVHYLEAYFDGEQIYLPTGSYKGEYTPNVTRYDSGRPSACFEKLTVWDLSGNEVGSIPAPVGFDKKNVRRDQPFMLGGRVFCDGRVWKCLEDVPPRREGLGKQISQEPSKDYEKEVTITRFALADGSVTITATAGYGSRFDPSGARITGVELKSSNGNWCATLPYLKNPGEVDVVAATDKKILLGTDLGHVEAINRRDGESQWMYIFPTARQTMSCSSGHWPPMMKEAAALYKRENQNRKPESGLVVDKANHPSFPRITYDPDPANPYGKLPLYLAIAWAGTWLPILLSALIIRCRRRKQLDSLMASISGLILTVAAICCFYFYARVSLATFIGLRFGIVVPLLVSLRYSIRALGVERRLFGAVVLLAGLVLVIFGFPMVL